MRKRTPAERLALAGSWNRLAGRLGTIWKLATPHGAVDVLHDAPGAAPYEQLRERALTIALDDLRIRVAGLDDLIRMKLARGRPVDRADVAALTEPPIGG